MDHKSAVRRGIRCALGLLVVWAVLLPACQGTEAITGKPFLEPYPNSKVIQSEQRGEEAAVEYEVSVPYPAKPVLEFIEAKLPPDFKPRTEDFMNPGIPTSHVRGWTGYEDSTTKPPSWVHHWAGEWEDSAGNILAYSLLYRSEASAPIDQPLSTQLHVLGHYYSRERVEGLREAVKEDPPATADAPQVVPNPGYVVLRPVHTAPFPGSREATVYERTFHFSEDEVLLDLRDVRLRDVETSDGEGGTAVLMMSLTNAGDEKLRTWTSANIGKQLGVFLDGRLISAPTIQSPLSSMFILDGELPKEEAEKTLARIRRGGAA